MSAALATAEVDCPRCDDKFTVSLHTGPFDTKTNTLPIRITDLAERFEEHYRTAGHTEA